MPSEGSSSAADMAQKSLPGLSAWPSRDHRRSQALIGTSILCPSMTNTDKMISQALAAALESGLVEKGQQVVITAGVPAGPADVVAAS